MTRRPAWWTWPGSSGKMRGSSRAGSAAVGSQTPLPAVAVLTAVFIIVKTVDIGRPPAGTEPKIGEPKA